MTKQKPINLDQHGQIKPGAQPARQENQASITAPPAMPAALNAEELARVAKGGAWPARVLDYAEAAPSSGRRALDRLRLWIGKIINWFVEPARIAANVGDERAFYAMRVNRIGRRLSKAGRPQCPDCKP